MGNLKNVNFMSYDKWQTIEKSDDELYNVNIDGLPPSFFTELNAVKMPDYKSGITLTNDVEYTAETSGYLHIRYYFGSSTVTRNVIINGYTFTSYHRNYNNDNIWMPIKKGDVYTLVGDFQSAEFYPSI